MLRFSKKTIGLIIVVIGLGSVFFIKLIKHHNLPGTQTSPAKVKGSPKAPINILEFADFECPACAEGAKFLKKFTEQYPDKVRLEMKFYPLTSIHKHAFITAKYAECASRQGKFWPLADMLFDRQNDWKKLADAQSVFDLMAIEVKADHKKLVSCLADQSVEDTIKKDKEEGSLLGVNSTPSYFVNGKMIVGFKSLEEELNKFLQ